MGVSDGEGILGFGIDWAGSLDGWEDVLMAYVWGVLLEFGMCYIRAHVL
jgi:hypothetical protein